MITRSSLPACFSPCELPGRVRIAVPGPTSDRLVVERHHAFAAQRRSRPRPPSARDSRCPTPASARACGRRTSCFGVFVEERVADRSGRRRCACPARSSRPRRRARRCSRPWLRAAAPAIAAAPMQRCPRDTPAMRIFIDVRSSRAGVPSARRECDRFRPRRVERIERIAAGHQAQPRAGRAVAERPAEARLRCSGAPAQHVGRQIGIRQHDAAEADEVAQALAHVVLRHVRQPLLQVAVARIRRTTSCGNARFRMRGRAESAARRRAADPPAARSRRAAETSPAAACAGCSTGCRPVTQIQRTPRRSSIRSTARGSRRARRRAARRSRQRRNPVRR